MTLKPLGTRVIIEVDAVQEYKTKGGIIMPEEAQEKPHNGTVIAVGTGFADMPEADRINVSDRVLFGKYSGSEIKVEDKTYLIMRYEDVMAIIDRKAEDKK